MLFPVEVERIPFDNKYTPEILKNHIERGVLGLLRIKHNGRIVAGYVIKINVYPTAKRLLEILFIFGRNLNFSIGKQIFKKLEDLAKKLKLDGIELTGRMQWNKVCDKLGFDNQQFIQRTKMADLLKRLQISEQQYGVGMEDNPFHNASPDECMHTCFGGSGGGSPPPPPPSTVTQQTSNIPEYFQPYLERLFERAEAVTTEPFQRYEGQRLATTTPQQQAAYQGVEEMVGGYKPYIATADLLTAQAAQQSTDPSAVAARMSPYQQAVIDIQKREALRDANKLQQQIGASAVGAGAFGGSRQALQESELARQTGQRLADIQAVGSQQAYQQAMNQLAADRAASLAAGQQFAGLGAQQQQLGLAGLGALETVGGTQQAQQQRALDIAYEDFAREVTRPSQQVQEMSSVLRGFNLPVSTYTTSQAQQAPPTFGQQAAGLGLGALGIYGAGKGVGLFAEGGEVPDNPGIKKLAAKAPQVVEKMGFDPQEVMNAYVGGRINYAEGDRVSDPFTEGGINYLISTFGHLKKQDTKEHLKKDYQEKKPLSLQKT